MSKINNFKVYFSEILKDKYSMSKESIDKYWDNKEKQIKFDNKKLVGSIVGVSELISTSVICIFDKGDSPKIVIPIVILGGIGVLTCKISTNLKNPYYLKEYKKIDEEYEQKKKCYKFINRKNKYN